MLGCEQISNFMLKIQLENIYKIYNQREYLEWDPLGMISPNLDPLDFEIYSFLAAGLAYGRVEQCRKSLQDIIIRLKPLGVANDGSGLRKLISENYSKDSMLVVLKGWKHRLNNHHDLIEIFGNMNSIFKIHKSLAELFQRNHHSDPKQHLINFCESLAPMKTRRHRGTGASWFAASPARGSSCKRFLLWLKWMIRKDNIDPGVWQNKRLLNPSLPTPSVTRLFVPVDTHVYQWALEHKATKQKSISWKTTEDITKFLKEICPEDPVRYDFAICHYGMIKFRKLDY